MLRLPGTWDSTFAQSYDLSHLILRTSKCGSRPTCYSLPEDYTVCPSLCFVFIRPAYRDREPYVYMEILISTVLGQPVSKFSVLSYIYMHNSVNTTKEYFLPTCSILFTRGWF